MVSDLARAAGIQGVNGETTVNVSDKNGRVRFRVHIQPRASKNEVVGAHGDALKIRLTAPPIDGAANKELVTFLSGIFAVGRKSIKIVGGESSRSKTIEIEGITGRAVHDVAAGVVTRP